MVEEALKHSEVSNLTFIGHSQGNAQMFHALSAYPEYWSDKINLFIALAPSTQLMNMTSSFLIFVADIIVVLTYVSA